VIHTRDADDDTARILAEEMSKGPFKAVLHCFTGGRALAEKGIELGLYVSFSGILTFPKSGDLRDLAASLPTDRLLVETDAPFLAPAPNRGKRNEPSYVRHTAKVLAGLKGVSEAEIAQITTTNFFRLFSKAKAAIAPAEGGAA
jgi:TatD DNase family protein